MPVIDAHAHYEARMLDVDAMLGAMDAHAVDQTVLIPCMNDPLPHTPAPLLSAMRVLMNSPFHRFARWVNEQFMTPEGHLKLQGQVIEIYAEPNNESVATLLRAYPHRFLGWIFLNPRAQPQALDVLETYRAIPGYVGVKLHPHWHCYDLRVALPLAKRCEELGLPVLIHLGFGEAGNLRVLTDACPRLRVIVAHAGFPAYRRMWPWLHTMPNVWVDVSSPYLNEALVRKAVACLGPSRILYGTDAPYGFSTGAPHAGCSGGHGHYDYGHIRGWVERLPLSSRDITSVLGGNAMRLLDMRLPDMP